MKIFNFKFGVSEEFTQAASNVVSKGFGGGLMTCAFMAAMGVIASVPIWAIWTMAGVGLAFYLMGAQVLRVGVHIPGLPKLGAK